MAGDTGVTERSAVEASTVDVSRLVVDRAHDLRTALVAIGRDVSDREQLRARLGELRTVNRLADAVARARTLDEILDEALAAILDGVGASRASVLLADAGGVMRFRAWIGL